MEDQDRNNGIAETTPSNPNPNPNPNHNYDHPSPSAKYNEFELSSLSNLPSREEPLVEEEEEDDEENRLVSQQRRSDDDLANPKSGVDFKEDGTVEDRRIQREKQWKVIYLAICFCVLFIAWNITQVINRTDL